MKPLDRAIEIAGGLSDLAKKIGVKSNTLNNWRDRGAPVDMCALIEKAVNCQVTCEELRPDKKEFWEYMRLPTSNPKPKKPKK